MIELKNITKKYERTVLDGFSFRFETNKIYVVKGVSGCGKTTLLNIIGGLETEFEGQYLFDGQEVKCFDKQQKEAFRQSFGYVFQSSLLLSNLTVGENLLFINNNSKMIEDYAAALKVSHLLSKFPQELSGGERQRIAVIRALLRNPSVILADEPTASLDNANSKETAKLFGSLKNKNRVIIISTHENCFDEIADEIIHLDYGKAGYVEYNDVQDNDGDALTGMAGAAGQNLGNSFKVLLPFVLRRHKPQYRLKALLPVIFVILVLLICFAIQYNFTDEYIRLLSRNYPIEVFFLTSGEYEKISSEYDSIEIFELYLIENDEYGCYPLFDKADSGLAYGDMIAYGSFPENNYEVLVSHCYAVDTMGFADAKEAVGKEVLINNREYRIAGVLSDIDNEPELDCDLYYSNIYYPSASSSSIFIPYRTLAEEGSPADIGQYMVKIEGLYENDDIYESIREELGGTISVWDSKLVNVQGVIEAVYRIVLVAFFIAALVAFVFIKNDIDMNLFYRRKELGYLQIFGIGKKTIRAEIMLERMLKNLIALLCAAGIYYGTVTALFLVSGISGFVPWYYIMLIAVLWLGFCYVNTLFPIKKFMKKSILVLITE